MRRLFLISVFVVTCDGASLLSVTCDPGMYYDPVVGRCDYCTVICDKSHIQGTFKECLEICPGFLSTSLTTKERDASISTMSITSTLPSWSCEAEMRTVTVLLLSLCIVSSLLIGLIAVVVMTTIRRSRSSTLSQRNRSTQPPLLDLNHNQT